MNYEEVFEVSNGFGLTECCDNNTINTKEFFLSKVIIQNMLSIIIKIIFALIEQKNYQIINLEIIKKGFQLI